jgi:hypothetical protein
MQPPLGTVEVPPAGREQDAPYWVTTTLRWSGEQANASAAPMPGGMKHVFWGTIWVPVCVPEQPAFDQTVASTTNGGGLTVKGATEDVLVGATDA